MLVYSAASSPVLDIILPVSTSLPVLSFGPLASYFISDLNY